VRVRIPPLKKMKKIMLNKDAFYLAYYPAYLVGASLLNTAL
jgi:hypothetical protein